MENTPLAWMIGLVPRWSFEAPTWMAVFAFSSCVVLFSYIIGHVQHYGWINFTSLSELFSLPLSAFLLVPFSQSVLRPSPDMSLCFVF